MNLPSPRRPPAGLGTQQTLRAAVASALAWLVVAPFGGVADQYPYYAPLGALVAVTASVAGSFREALQVIAAIALGIGVAVASTWLPGQLLSLVAVVAVGSWLALVGLRRWLGGPASWVAMTGLFVLVIGGQSPWDYAGAYLGFVSLGAVVGSVVSLVWPPLPLRAEARDVARLRAGLADHLASVAHALTDERPPTPQEWEARTHGLGQLVGRLRGVARASSEYRRFNWRARRWSRTSDVLQRQLRALDRLALLALDLVDVLIDHEHAELEQVALGPGLRPPVSRVLHDLVAVLCDGEGSSLEAVTRQSLTEEVVQRAERSVSELAAMLRQMRDQDGQDLLTAASVVTTVNRTLSALAPLRG